MSRHLRVYETERQHHEDILRRMWRINAFTVVLIAALIVGRMVDLPTAWSWPIAGLTVALVAALLVVQTRNMLLITRKNRGYYRGRH